MKKLSHRMVNIQGHPADKWPSLLLSLSVSLLCYVLGFGANHVFFVLLVGRGSSQRPAALPIPVCAPGGRALEPLLGLLASASKADLLSAWPRQIFLCSIFEYSHFFCCFCLKLHKITPLNTTITQNTISCPKIASYTLTSIFSLFCSLEL